MAALEKETQSERLFVTFALGSEQYGIDIMDAQEIIHLSPVTPIPNSPDFVEGVINLRGAVIPVLDLRKRFTINEEGEKSDDQAVVVIKVEEVTVGVIIDRVLEVIRIKENDIQPPPPGISPIGQEYIAGVGKVEGSLVILLNAKRLLTNPEKGLLQESLSDSN